MRIRPGFREDPGALVWAPGSQLVENSVCRQERGKVRGSEEPRKVCFAGKDIEDIVEIKLLDRLQTLKVRDRSAKKQ